ncbi:hypothetical protein [Pseudomonas sp. OV226]|uniref:hypothetical protein n=1 Tax=Pseudomonas sp. OV226 TaxID=2135588 RepID=UPI000D6C4486|nr:hypothetical protein [Pseudomonas sp. OV226]PWK28107.1 hypothetical protein C7534_14017 [Pseudomonas sp. OV226]
MKGNTSRTWCFAWGMLLTVMTLLGCTPKPERSAWSGYTPPANLQYQEDAAQELSVSGTNLNNVAGTLRSQ